MQQFFHIFQKKQKLRTLYSQSISNYSLLFETYQQRIREFENKTATPISLQIT